MIKEEREVLNFYPLPYISHQVNMQMVYYLRSAAIDNQTISLIFNLLLANHFLNNFSHFSPKPCVFKCQKIRNMFFWNYQKMNWGYGMNVGENHNIVIFITEFFCNFFVGDFTE